MFDQLVVVDDPVFVVITLLDHGSQLVAVHKLRLAVEELLEFVSCDFAVFVLKIEFRGRKQSQRFGRLRKDEIR